MQSGLPRFHLKVTWCVLIVVTAGMPHTLAQQPKVDTPQASTVYTITAKQIENLPTCGRTLTSLAGIAPTPALNITTTQLSLSAADQAGFSLSAAQLETADGMLQSAAAPFCVDNISILSQPIKVHYGNSVVGTINIQAKTPPAGWKPYVPPGAATSFLTSPLYLPGEVLTVWGSFGAGGPDSVLVGDAPATILARTPTTLYWTLPQNVQPGPLTVTVFHGAVGAKFEPILLGLALSADKLQLLKGESTRMQATVFGPEHLPKDAWIAGEVMDMSSMAKHFPGYTIPKPGEPARLFLRIDNVSRDTVSMSPSSNESFTVALDQGNFSAGPYTYKAAVRSFKAGNFQINGAVVGFFRPIAGVPVGHPVVAQQAPPPRAPMQPIRPPLLIAA